MVFKLKSVLENTKRLTIFIRILIKAYTPKYNKLFTLERNFNNEELLVKFLK